VLINNAGMTTDQHTTTSEGHELCLAVNHLAPFLLTRELLPLLEAAAPARVVTVSSALYASAKRLDLDELASPARYSWQDVYNRTKLANVLFTRALSRRLEGTGVTANCLHPGVIATGFGSDLGGIGGWMFGAMKWFLPGPEAGARTSVHLASSPAVQDTTGGYFEKSTPKPLKGLATDDALAESLWTWTEERLKA